MNVGLILAAGRGNRFGGDRPKQFQVLNDAPVLQHSLRVFEAVSELSGYGVLVGSEWTDTVHELLDNIGATKCEFVVEGGASRRESVSFGLEEWDDHDPGTVLVHDAARPGVRSQLIESLYECWASSPPPVRGVIPVVPVRNTIKQVDNDTGRVETTLDRDQLRAVQTPQLFDYDRLLEVHRGWDSSRTATDDASMLEYHGDEITTVPGHDQNMKITRPGDLGVASRRIEES